MPQFTYALQFVSVAINCQISGVYTFRRTEHHVYDSSKICLHRGIERRTLLKDDLGATEMSKFQLIYAYRQTKARYFLFISRFCWIASYGKQFTMAMLVQWEFKFQIIPPR